MVNLERFFEQAVAGAFDEVGQARAPRRVAGNEEKPVGQKWIIARDLRVKRLAVHARHHQIADDCVEVCDAEFAQRFHAVGGAFGDAVLVGQHFAEHIGQLEIVVLTDHVQVLKYKP